MRNLNGRIYDVCPDCGKIVQVNKAIVGGLHICTTVEERALYSDSITAKVRANQELLKDLD